MSTAAGESLHHEEITTFLKGARAYVVRYASRDVGGGPAESTGVVIAPLAAGTDRPGLTWMHGTTGIGDAARPSARPDPARDLITCFDVDATEDVDYGVPGAQSYIDDGWIVVRHRLPGSRDPRRAPVHDEHHQRA